MLRQLSKSEQIQTSDTVTAQRYLFVLFMNFVNSNAHWNTIHEICMRQTCQPSDSIPSPVLSSPEVDVSHLKKRIP